MKNELEVVHNNNNSNGNSKISRIKLLIITAALIITSTWLPGGLLPQWAHDKKTQSYLEADELARTTLGGTGDGENINRNSDINANDKGNGNIDDNPYLDSTDGNRNTTNQSKYSFIKNTFRRDSYQDVPYSTSAKVAVADLRIDSKGMLLHPTCDSHNQSISSTAHALVHVRCTSSSPSSSTLYINGEGSGGYFGIHGLHLASIRDTSRLFCGDISRANIARKCLPILVKAARLYQPAVYREFIQEEWDAAINDGLSLCCAREEMRKPINKVNITNCGIPCQPASNATKEETGR